MPATQTLAQVRTLVRERADMVNSQFCTDAELNSFINLAYYELYDVLVQKFGEDYFLASPYSITTDGTNFQYALPADFFKLLGVDMQLAGTTAYATIPRFNFGERNRFAVPANQSFVAPANLSYRLAGGKIWLSPLPSASINLRLWYVPRLTALSADADVLDGISGWEAYVIVGAAIMALAKEESDVSVLMAEKAALLQRIESAAENRDAGMPATVVDLNSGRFGWPWNGGFE